MSQGGPRQPRLASILRSRLRRRDRVRVVNTTSGAKPHRWLREAGIYALLYGVPLLLLFPYTNWRPDGRFQATIRTDAVDFEVGPYTGSGPFVSPCADVGLDQGSFYKIVLPSATPWKALSGGAVAGMAETIRGGRLRFRHVDFQSLVVASGTSIGLRWNARSPDGLTMRLTYTGAPKAPAALIVLNEKSSMEFAASRLSETDGERKQNGVIVSPGTVQGAVEVYPADVNLTLSVNPCAQPRNNSPVPGPQRAPTQAALPTADNIPLLAGSRIAFIADDNNSGILEGNNTVEVKNAGRKETLFRGQRLEIARLKNRSLTDHSLISLKVKDGIIVNVVARAGLIRIDGDDARPSLAEWLRAQKILSAWLATSILIGSALLTVFSRIKLVKLDQK